MASKDHYMIELADREVDCNDLVRVAAPPAEERQRDEADVEAHGSPFVIGLSGGRAATRPATARHGGTGFTPGSAQRPAEEGKASWHNFDPEFNFSS